MQMKWTIVAGARPNFVKIAAIINAINQFNKHFEIISFRLVHTGQHYDENMSNLFFNELNIPKPDVNLGCIGKTQAQLTASILTAFEEELLKNISHFNLTNHEY